MNRRIIAGLTAAITLFSSIAVMMPECIEAEDKENVLHIDSVDDLVEFSRNCRLDSYSDGLTVELDCDLDLAEDPFTPIPTFMGTFHGNGHTISGFVCANDGSNQGFFRYIEEEGLVTKLTVKGEVSPETGQENIGGIVGTNYGTLKYCTFIGDVTGLEHTGGVVGYNEGTLLVCTAEGDVEGKNYTGGICGFNEGSLIGCRNESSVNIEVQTSDVDVADLASVDVEDLETLASADTDSVKDTGGIVGGSEGIVKNCTNKGTVGYQHYGYNVGGIAGRQSGFITGCENYGEVYGKKDVAGICGQMEPHLYILDSASLSEELQNLNDSISNAMADLSGDANSMRGALSSLSGLTDGATADASTYESLINDLFGDDDDSEASEKAAQTITDIGNTISGVDDSTKSDILNGNADSSTVDKVIDSAKENGGSTGEAAGNIADQVIEDSGSISDSTIEDIKNGNVTADDVSEITNAASNSAAASGISSATEAIKAKKAAEDAADQAKVTALANMISDTQSALTSKIGVIGDALSDMNDKLADITGDLAENMSAVNEQFERVNNLLTCMLTGDMIYYEDISALDTEEDTDGKISYCVNYANIEGDEDVGGISGEVALEKEIDEDESIISNGLSISGVDSQMYETRAVVRSCSNEAAVYGRKSYVGGIIGKGDTGMVIYSENYGDVSSDSEYVGGIAGNSDTMIVDSYAMCDLSGDAYIGGIAGHANQITNCMSIVTIADEHACCSGAIAGYMDVTTVNAAVNNYFISDTLGAIDGISYHGKAEPTTPEELYTNEDIPEEFRKMVVTFEADGVTVDLVKVEYGTNLKETDIPKVPKKDGYTGVWEDIPEDAITSNIVIEAAYYEKQDSLESEMVRDDGGLSVVIVEGEFEGNATVTASEYEGEVPDTVKGTVLEALNISIDNGDKEESEDGYKVRYLAPDKDTDVTIYRICEDGSLEELSSQVSGSYVTFAVPSSDTNIVCVSNSDNNMVYILGGCAAAVLILGFLLIRKKKAGKKKKKA